MLEEGLDRELLQIDRGLDWDAHKHVEGRVASSHPEWPPTALRAIQPEVADVACEESATYGISIPRDPYHQESL